MTDEEIKKMPEDPLKNQGKEKLVHASQIFLNMTQSMGEKCLEINYNIIELKYYLIPCSNFTI